MYYLNFMLLIYLLSGKWLLDFSENIGIYGKIDHINIIIDFTEASQKSFILCILSVINHRQGSCWI
jgi:hypothetical protein